MNEQLQNIYNSFCKLKDEMNTSNVTEKTVNLITRFSKAVKIAESIVENPPKRDTSFDAELHLKSSTYASASLKKEVKKIPQKRGRKSKK